MTTQTLPLFLIGNQHQSSQCYATLYLSFVCPTWANGSIPHQWENFTFGVLFSSFLSTIRNAVLISETRFRFVNYKAGHENTDVYDLEPMPGTPHTHLEYIGSQGELEGNYLQQRFSSTIGKTCEFASHSGPKKYFRQSTSAFHRPHDREIYYEIVADSNELQKGKLIGS